MQLVVCSQCGRASSLMHDMAFFLMTRQNCTGEREDQQNIPYNNKNMKMKTASTNVDFYYFINNFVLLLCTTTTYYYYYYYYCCSSIILYYIYIFILKPVLLFY
jgi:hypothetical protein